MTTGLLVNWLRSLSNRVVFGRDACSLPRVHHRVFHPLHRFGIAIHSSSPLSESRAVAIRGDISAGGWLPGMLSDVLSNLVTSCTRHHVLPQCLRSARRAGAYVLTPLSLIRLCWTCNGRTLDSGNTYGPFIRAGSIPVVQACDLTLCQASATMPIILASLS